MGQPPLEPFSNRFITSEDQSIQARFRYDDHFLDTARGGYAAPPPFVFFQPPKGLLLILDFQYPTYVRSDEPWFSILPNGADNANPVEDKGCYVVHCIPPD